ncbi:MAG: leucine-rich repeat protein [Prevotella sp.]|nr:leucine-rich repeat protein [Prevotella sp.]
MKKVRLTHLRCALLMLSLALPLMASATDVVVADANGNELTYSYDSADGPATFKTVKTYASDASKAGRIIIADAVTDANGVSHQVLYVSGGVGNRGNLVSITFGKNIIAVGGPDGTSNYAFSGCSKLVSVTLNSKVQILGSHAFRDCAALSSINLSAATSLTTIKNDCFDYCHALTSITLPASLTSIENYGFYQCNNLKTVTFTTGTGNLTLGKQVFYNCDKLETVSFPGNLTSLGDQTFDNCALLRSCVFNGSPNITTIPYNTFAGCPSLQSITLPDAVETIGQGVFYACTSLTEINFGTGLTSLGTDYTWCGSNMTNLQKLTFPGPNYPFEQGYALPGSITLYVNPDLVDTYRTNDFTKKYHIVPIGQPTTISVTTTAGGQLEQKVMAKGDPANIIELTVSGPLNGTDINFLHQQMWGLQKLDLTNASIVAGGDSYARWHWDNGAVTQYGSTVYNTEANVVGNFMFYDMPHLRSLKLPSGTTAIGEYAICQERDHGNRFRLTECPIPSGVKTIGRDAFYYTGITQVTVPSGVTALEQEVFWHCEKLVSATLSNGLKTIGHGPFSECYALETVNIPSTVESIGDYAFFNNKVRTSPLVIPASCKSIGNYAFRYNWVLPSITFNEGLESIGYAAFSECKAVAAISLPSTITSIGDWAFEYCEAITQFTVPANIKAIPRGLVYHCGNLTTATLPTGVTEIGSRVFHDCTKLTTVNGLNQTTLTTVYGEAFRNTGLTTVTLPNSIAWMEGSVFEDCANLTTVNVPTGIDYVPNAYCFNCPNLTTVTMHNGIRTIKYRAFRDCVKLPSIVLNDQITRIEYDAFWNCKELVLTKLPTALTYIGGSSFRETPKITGTLTIPDGVTEIAGDAFNGCAISSVVLPDGLTTLGNSVFCNTPNLVSVKLPANLTRIPNYTFQKATALQHINLPATVTEIGWMAFDQSGLTEIDLPENITNIDGYAFSNSQLQTFRVPDGFTADLGSHCFENCKRLKSIYFGRNQDYSQWTSFTAVYGCDSLQLMRVYAGTPPKSDTYSKDFRSKCVLEVPEGTESLYQEATFWKDFKEIRSFFMGAVLDDLDYAVLKKLYRELGGTQWKSTQWDLDNNHYATGKWAGVTTVESSTDLYRITGINLSAQGLTGQLPDSLFLLKQLQTLNLSNNQLTGNIGTLFNGKSADALAPLTELYLQGNLLTGDIYPFASKLTTLTKLDVSYNRLTDISQVIPKTTLTNFTYNRQFFDYATSELVVPSNAPVTDVTVGVPFTLPTNRLSTYRHSNQDFGYTSNDLARFYHTNSYYTPWPNVWEFYKTDGQWNLYTSNYPLKAEKDKVLAYSIGGNQQTILLRLTWTDGDVNADQTVDVTDLQSVIYYALNDAKPAGVMYNFACSDTNGDEKINVSDIVGTVDFLLGFEQPSGSRARINNMVSPESSNLITVSGSSVTLANSDEVAALQLTVSGANSRQLNVSNALRAGFSVTMRDVVDGVRIVVYSPAGNTLAAGEHELLNSLPTGATVSDVYLSNAEARHLGVTVVGDTATGVGSVAVIQQQTGQVYDLQGRPVGPWHSLPQGVYVVNVNGKQFKVKK